MKNANIASGIVMNPSHTLDSVASPVIENVGIIQLNCSGKTMLKTDRTDEVILIEIHTYTIELGILLINAILLIWQVAL